MLRACVARNTPEPAPCFEPYSRICHRQSASSNYPSEISRGWSFTTVATFKSFTGKRHRSLASVTALHIVHIEMKDELSHFEHVGPELDMLLTRR